MLYVACACFELALSLPEMALQPAHPAGVGGPLLHVTGIFELCCLPQGWIPLLGSLPVHQQNDRISAAYSYLHT